MEAIRKTLGLVNGNTVDVYQLEDGKFVYSMTSLAHSASNDVSHVRRFLMSDRFKAIAGEDFHVRQVKSGRVWLNAVPSFAAVAYWVYAGEVELVVAYAGAALDQYAAKAFGVVLDIQETAQDIYDKLRSDHKTIHNAMQSHCQAHGYQPWVASKLIAEAVTGRPYELIMDGVEYRKAWSPDLVSLDELKTINKVKQEFVNCRQRTTQANVTKACQKAKVVVKLVG